jgi:hypothetical protein
MTKYASETFKIKIKIMWMLSKNASGRFYVLVQELGKIQDKEVTGYTNVLHASI